MYVFTELYALVQTEVYSERYAKAPATERENPNVSVCLQRLGAVSELRLAVRKCMNEAGVNTLS
jgi:hypothetical protein